EQPCLTEIDQLNQSSFVKYLRSVGRAPFVACLNLAMPALRLGSADVSANNTATAGALGPEIDAFHSLHLLFQRESLRNNVSRANPGGLRMDVVLRAGRSGLHRPRTRQRKAASSMAGPEIGLGYFRPEMIAGDQVLSNGEVNRFLRHFDLDVRSIFRTRLRCR